jgi:hypothetical protein
VKWPHRRGTLVEGESHTFVPSFNEMFPSSLLEVSTFLKRESVSSRGESVISQGKT